MIGTLSLNHVIEGVGLPETLHVNTTFVPSNAAMSLGVASNVGGWLTK